MSTADRTYYETRLRDSLARAAQALDPDIAAIHREFAVLYQRKLSPAGGPMLVDLGRK